MRPAPTLGHADTAVRRVSKLSPDPIYPAYAVGDADNNSDTTRVVAVTGERSSSNQLEELLRRVPTPAEPPAPKPEVPAVEKLLQQLVKEQRPARRYWTDMVCFSCGKSGHAATRCPNLDESFPFMQPGWQTEKTPGGFIMIPPRVAMDRRRAENSGRPGRGGSCLGSVDTFGPGTQEVEQYRLFPHDG